MAATSNTALRVTELDFDSIKSNLKTFLRSQSEFQDFDFEGSGMSVLLDVLAYNTHYMGYYLNVTANEMFLDTAQIRASVLSHAKAIGYVPESKKGAQARINIQVTPSTVENNTATTLVLDKYTKFLGEAKDGTNYPFVTVNSNSTIKINTSFSFSNISIRQGEVVTAQFTMSDSSNPKRRFNIPSSNVDIETISVTVQESSSNTDTISYKLAQDITELTGSSAVFFIEENQDSEYTLYFGDGVIGKKPKNGNIIVCTYLDTIGSPANNVSKFNIQVPISGYSDNIIVTGVDSSFGGAEKETVEQIRFRAPYHYTTQNRAVTALDYETLVLKDFGNIDAVSVWGGEENDPIVYGKVYLSLKTKGDYGLSNLEKENIKEALIRNRNVVTVIPEIIDPDYVYLQITGKVDYDPSLTSLTANELKSLVRAAILDYNDDELNTFKSTFRESKLQLYIENAEKSITSSDITVYLQKRVTLDIEQLKNYSLKYNIPLRKGDFLEKLNSFPQVRVSDVEGISRDVFFEEVPESFTGIDAVTVIKPGINYVSAPTVTINGDGIGATAVAVVINGKINRVDITNRGSNYTRATVSITGGGGSEAVATAKLENKLGVLRSFYYRSNGEKIIVNSNAGTINYDTGLVIINSIYPIQVTTNNYYEADVLTINVPAQSEIIRPLRNRILTIDPSDASSILIEMVPEK
jgi:hypothetical protein